MNNTTLQLLETGQILGSFLITSKAASCAKTCITITGAGLFVLGLLMKYTPPRK